MKKYLFFILIIFMSCSEENSSSSSQTIVKNEANFILSKNSQIVDWSNIQVGETLKFDVKIQNFDLSSDVVYVLKPITSNAASHQRNKIDYNFQEGVKIDYSGISGFTKDSILTQENRDSIIIKKANTSFFVSILKPGNFTQQYELRKMRSKKYVAGSTEEILFSAVKIEVYTWNEQTENATMFRNSQHSRYYEFVIDDGDQTNDTYLTDTETKKNTYTTLYNDIKYDEGPLKINEALNFSKKVNTEKGAQIVPNWILSELKIIQKRDNEPSNIIIYNNLTIKQK